MSIEVLEYRVPIRVTGADAQKLLNDVLTAVFSVGAQQAAWWALLSPQGKIQAEGLGFIENGAVWLDVHESVAEGFLKRMRLYKLRADVTIEDMGSSHAVGWSPESVPDALCRREPRGEGWHVIASSEAQRIGHVRRARLDMLIGNGIAELGEDYSPDTLFPHDVGMDLLGGVDFAKGCYVGQEVVSRMQHRGTARRRPVIVSGDGLETGATLEVGGREIGTLGRVSGGKAVAIVRIDRIIEPDAATSNGAPVSLALPDWASYRFGQSMMSDSSQD